MTIPHSVRASDHPEILRASREDFVIRKPHPSIRRGYQLSLLLAAIIIGISVLVLNNALTASLMFILVGGIMYLLARRIERLQNMLMATEFSNALFTSALAKGFAFTCIAAEDGEIIYLDRAFQSMFPDFIDQPRRTLDLLMTTYSTPTEQRQYIASLVKQSSRADVPLTITYGDNEKPRQITVAIDPIERPKGFVMLRGRVA